jgi:hypothetical protein
LTAAAFKVFWIGPTLATDFAIRLRPEGWADAAAWRSVASAYLRHFLDLGASRWSYAWPALVLLVALGVHRARHRRRPEDLVMPLTGAIILSWALFFPVSPFGTETHLQQALERLLLQPFPLLTVLALWRVESAIRRDGGAGPAVGERVEISS